MQQFLVFVLFLFLPVIAEAHGAGAYFETVAGAYVVDVGYSTPAPQDTESVIFDFQLRDKNTKLTQGTDVTFTDVWVKIESEDKQVVFASGIYNAEFGGPRMSYVFPKPGTYLISVRYENGQQSLTETSFPMTVLPAPPDSGTGAIESVWYLLGGVVLGLLGTYLVRRKS